MGKIKKLIREEDGQHNIKQINNDPEDSSFRRKIKKNNLTEKSFCCLKIHTGEKLYKCEVCERAFTQKGDLTKHFLIHTGDKRFSCAHCGKEFTWKSSLKTHLVKCFRKHGFENQIKDHLSRSSNDENPSGEVHICEACLRGFKKRNEFVTHQKTHTKVKTFECAHCGNDFLKKRFLKFHLVKCFSDYGFENQFQDI